ncbi:periplasmic binding protein-like I [Chytridium lagenaria]|nr:periplasmic binding protein-like I [Chytridium lagenaria]
MRVGLALWFLVGMVVTISSQPLPQKTKSIKIGYLMPFSQTVDLSDELSVLSNFMNSINSVMCYNVLKWYFNRTNNDPNILPDTRIDLVPINSRSDRGVSLTASQQIINQDRVAAIIGETSSRNTVTMAVAAAISNVLHCSNLATTPQLANKVDYPTTFRTQSTALLQARGMLAAVNRLNKTTVGIFASSDELGNGMTQLLQLNAANYNVSISLVVVYDISKADYRDDLHPFIDGRVQTILVIAGQFPIVNIMRSASQLNMLNGDYWLISSTGWTDAMFGGPSTQGILRNITGTWQIQTPLFEDRYLLPDGSNAEAVEMRSWWEGLFVPLESPCSQELRKRSSKATLIPFTAATAAYVFPSNCPNDPQLNISSSISKFIFQSVVNNQTMTLQAAGNMCTGPGLNYLEGYMSMFALNTQYFALRPTDYMQNTVKCGKILVGMFDRYVKTGQITLLSVAKGNISQLINNASIMGDLQMEQDILNYKFVNVSSRKQVVQGVPFKANKSVRYAFVAIIATCSLFTIGLFIYMMMYSAMKIFMASSPNFLTLILIGANVSYIAIYLYSIYPMRDESCIVFGWLKYLGFAIVFGALLVKTYRISVIFVNKRNKVRKLNDTRMFVYFGIFVSLWVILLVVWTVIPSQRPYLQVDTVANAAKNGTILFFDENPHCEFNNYNYVCLGAMVLTLGLVNTPSAFNESKWISMAIYNWVVIGIVLNAISNFAVKDPDVIFVMEALVVILTQTGVAASLFASQGSEKQSTQNMTQSTHGMAQSSHGLHGMAQSSHGLPKRLLKQKETGIGKIEAENVTLRSENTQLRSEVAALTTEVQKLKDKSGG